MTSKFGMEIKQFHLKFIIKNKWEWIGFYKYANYNMYMPIFLIENQFPDYFFLELLIEKMRWMSTFSSVIKSSHGHASDWWRGKKTNIQ